MLLKKLHRIKFKLRKEGIFDVGNRVPGFNTLVKEKLLQLCTFHQWDSKHERSGTAGRAVMCDIGLCEVLV